MFDIFSYQFLAFISELLQGKIIDQYYLALLIGNKDAYTGIIEERFEALQFFIIFLLVYAITGEHCHQLIKPLLHIIYLQ